MVPCIFLKHTEQPILLAWRSAVQYSELLTSAGASFVRFAANEGYSEVIQVPRDLEHRRLLVYC